MRIINCEKHGLVEGYLKDCILLVYECKYCKESNLDRIKDEDVNFSNFFEVED